MSRDSHPLPLAEVAGLRALMYNRKADANFYFECANRQAEKDGCTRVRHDSLANNCVTAARLGIPTLANGYFSEMICLPLPSAMTMSSLVGPPQGPSMPSVSGEISNSITNILTGLSHRLLVDPQDFEARFERSRLFREIGNYEESLADVIKLSVQKPDSIAVWAECADRHAVLNDAKGLSKACEMIEQLGGTTHRFRAQTCIWEDDYDGYERELRLASEADEDGAQHTWLMHLVSCGKYDVENIGDADFPYDIFMEPLLPVDAKFPEFPFVAQVIAGYYKTFREPIHKITPALGLSTVVISAWINGRTLPSEYRQILPDPLLPPDFNGSPQGDTTKLPWNVISANLMKEAKGNDRLVACMSFAAIEISQLITKWVKSPDAAIPRLDLILAIIILWVRVAVPDCPVASRLDFWEPAKTSVPVDNAQVVKLVKDMLGKTLTGDLREAVDNAKDAVELLDAVCNGVTVRLPSTNISISINRHCDSRVELCLIRNRCIGSKRVSESLISAWIRLLNDIRQGVRTRSMFDFLRHWLMVVPVRTQSNHSYVIVMLVAILHSMGYSLGATAQFTPADEMSAVLCGTTDEFISCFHSMSLPLIPATEYADIATVLPNIQARFNVFRPHR